MFQRILEKVYEFRVVQLRCYQNGKIFHTYNSIVLHTCSLVFFYHNRDFGCDNPVSGIPLSPSMQYGDSPFFCETEYSCLHLDNRAKDG